jgi:hypothetical protein
MAAPAIGKMVGAIPETHAEHRNDFAGRAMRVVQRTSGYVPTLSEAFSVGA